jgi:hypothetical protein
MTHAARVSPVKLTRWLQCVPSATLVVPGGAKALIVRRHERCIYVSDCCSGRLSIRDNLAYTAHEGARPTLCSSNGCAPPALWRVQRGSLEIIYRCLTSELDDPSKIVRLYALVGKLRLFGTASVISRAEEVMQLIVETYNLPNRDFRNLPGRQGANVDVVRAFSEACRGELPV